MTEAVDPRYRDLDAWPTAEAMAAIWESQLAAVASVGPALPLIARAVDLAADRLGRGDGRLCYAGAGTSARVAAQDGIELGPTYDWPEGRMAFLLAGGEDAVMRSVEGAEDDAADAEAQATRAGLGPPDVLIGLAASGRTPFTVAVVRAARAAGALTVGVASNPDSPLLLAADIPILTETGPEVVAGSTRMKAGTAQKVVLNMISTGIMARLGRVHDGQMVAMRPLNDKLRARATEMVARIAGCDFRRAATSLEAAGWSIREAVLVARGATPADAALRLADAGGRLRAALGGPQDAA